MKNMNILMNEPDINGTNMLRQIYCKSQISIWHCMHQKSAYLNQHVFIYVLEIKPYGFESRIRDMEAESYN